MKTIEQRFWIKVNKTENCWLWIAGQNGTGYGTFYIKHSEPICAHKFSYQIHKGQVPLGFDLDHLCRVRHCVNPNHLEPVTRRENLLRGKGITAINAQKTHCYKGHEFTPENTHIKKNGTRRCRTCHRKNAKERYHRISQPRLPV